MTTDLQEKTRSGPIDGVKTQAYMFFKILEQVQEIELVLVELFDYLHDRMFLPASL